MAFAIRRGAFATVFVLLGALLASCSRGSASDDTTPSSAQAAVDQGQSKTLVFYLEQTGTTDMVDGVNLATKPYTLGVRNCPQGAEIRRLTPKEEAKLGTAHLRYWQDGNGRIARWVQQYKLVADFEVKPLSCNFSVSETSELEIWKGSPDLSAKHLIRAYVIDMVKHTGGMQLVPYTPEDPGLPSAKMSGLPPEILSTGAKSSFLGWPCLVVHNKINHRTSCVWTGGGKFGFSPTAPEEFPEFRGTPTLWGKSDKGGNSFTTVKFMVGTLPNANVFDIPADVKIVDQGGP